MGFSQSINVPKNETAPVQQMSEARRAFFAARVKKEAGTDPEAQVRRVFRLAFQRDPTATELPAAVQLVEKHGLAALCRAVLNANEFLYVD